jgi:hypothetical protein
MLVRNIFFDHAYVSPENFFDLPPSTTFREKFVRLGQNPRKCSSKHDDTPPPPNVDGFATSLATMTTFFSMMTSKITDFFEHFKVNKVNKAPRTY